MSGGSLRNSGNSLSSTAFGELLVGQLTPVFQGSFEYTVDNTELNTNTLTDGGTVTQASAMAVLGTSTTTASDALFQSKRHAKYHSGLGGLQRFTALFSTGVAATDQLIGLADEIGSSATFKNGYMIGYNNSDTIGIHRFANDGVETILQSAWDDSLDGTGASGMVADFTKLNVFEIRFQYLGAGEIQFCIENPKTGSFFIFHKIKYANSSTVPSCFNPNFNFTMWVDNKATSSDIVMKSASYGFFVEGKTKYQEIHQPDQSSGIREKTTVTTEVAIFTIRNKTTYASKTNFIDIVLLNTSAAIEASGANNLGNFRLVKNATLGGTPSYSDINTANSVVEIDTAGTTVTGGVELMAALLAGKNDSVLENLSDFDFIISPGETVTLVGASPNSAATIDGTLLWKALF